MTWQALAIIGPLFIVGYQSFSKLFPKDIPIFLVTMYSSLVGAAVMLVLHLFLSETKSLAVSTKLLPVTIVIGALIALGNASIIRAYGLGATQSGFTSIFYPLLIIYALIAGLIFWHEKLNLMQGVGLLLTIGGIFLVTFYRS